MDKSIQAVASVTTVSVCASARQGPHIAAMPSLSLALRLSFLLTLAHMNN